MMTTRMIHVILSIAAYVTSTTASIAYNAYPYALPAAYSTLPAVRSIAPVVPAAPAVFPAAPVPVARSAPLIAAPAVRTAYPAAPALLRAAPVAAPLAAAPVAAAPVAPLDYADAYPQYRFAYDIQDSLTGDSKTQEEVREGGVVKGRYSLLEADGSRRTVNYYADPLNGFNAVIQKDVPVVAAAAPVVRAAVPPVVAV